MNIYKTLFAISVAGATLGLSGCMVPKAPTVVDSPSSVAPPPVTPTPTYEEPDPVTVLRSTYNTCKAINKQGISAAMKYVKIYDGGHTAVINTRSEGNDVAGAACLLYGIDTPQAIIARIDSTTALQGQETARANGFIYRWTYHPDNGLNMVIEER